MKSKVVPMPSPPMRYCKGGSSWFSVYNMVEKVGSIFSSPSSAHARADNPAEFRSASAVVVKAGASEQAAGGGRLERSLARLLRAIDSTSPPSTVRLDVLNHLVAYLQVRSTPPCCPPFNAPASHPLTPPPYHTHQHDSIPAGISNPFGIYTLHL